MQFPVFPMCLALGILLGPRLDPQPQESATPRSDPELSAGLWRAWLDCPGGPLPFGLAIDLDQSGAFSCELVNGPERIAVPSMLLMESDSDGPDRLRVQFDFPHYDSSIVATLSDDGARLDGEYAKRLGSERWRRLPFHATFISTGQDTGSEVPTASSSVPLPRFEGRTAPAGDLRGRWRMNFESSADAAVGLFEQDAQGRVQGTILTSTGDYRYLAGSMDGPRLRLSVFDGAHAFLFDATLDATGKLNGDFWSGDTWHETWSAERDDRATLPDPFAATLWEESASLANVLLPDLDGRLRALADPRLRGRATLVVLFGSWCPNCHDEAPYLVELLERFGPEGLRIVGLAFEFTGNAERDTRQLQRFAARWGIEYPLLLAGTADKAAATQAFGGVDFVRSYPTTLFVDNAGQVRWIHSGFAGPATGPAHEELRREFEVRIAALLSEPEADQSALAGLLTSTAWRTDRLGSNSTVVFSPLPDGQLVAHVIDDARDQAPEETSVQLVGADAVWLGDRLYRFDGLAQVLLCPTSFGERLMPANAMDSALLVAAGFPGLRETPQALQHDDPIVRREAVWSLGRRRMRSAGASAQEFLPLLADQEVEVAVAAVWAVAATGDLHAAPSLGALSTHPNARVRREVARGLKRMARMNPILEGELAPLARDPDPLVRAIVRGD